MKFSVQFDCDSAAFETLEAEIARVLQNISVAVEYGSLAGKVYDLNGNVVGLYQMFGHPTNSLG